MMKNQSYKKAKPPFGFTLVEMLVYLAIFMIVATASVGFLISLNRFVDQYRLETMLYRSGTNAMEQIMLGVRQADSIDLLNTVEDDPSAGQLALENSATTTSFTLNAGAIDFEINSEDFGNLLSPGVTADDFTVYHYSTATGDFVRVRLTMTATIEDSAPKTITIYGGGVIRGSL